MSMFAWLRVFKMMTRRRSVVYYCFGQTVRYEKDLPSNLFSGSGFLSSAVLIQRLAVPFSWQLVISILCYQ